MIIRDMFKDDINRKIDGVVKVGQDSNEVIEQEVREYVITKELKKHFISFFNYYGESFEKPTSDIGVWISGFFGSGKSHFLKMLSYLLENKEVNGKKTAEVFRDKFADDPGTFMMIDKATKNETETILFNIDVEGSINKDKTAVLRVFAKVFYNHLGFFGENLKVAMLEKYIDEAGKTDEFRAAFEEIKGKPWVEFRKAALIEKKSLIKALVAALDFSEEDAREWINDKSEVAFSISQLVADINEYVSKKPDNFRLLFMIDEVGQYVGTDTDLLLNLQSIVEEIGSVCAGKVWVCCTGQEALDRLIKVRNDEFSRIRARFKTTLSLTSSSVDEVVQKRILAKNDDATVLLEEEYEKNESALRNLFSFSDSVLDVKGYSNAVEFAVNYPYVPYQFIIMQKVFNQIREHGNVGAHQANGERSMLSGFQEATQVIQLKNETALVPFYMFYDTLHSFLDTSIRSVIERCQKAADNHYGLEQMDVNTLKLLYLIRYIDDIKATLDNIVVLMSDSIDTNKVVMRQLIGESLDRLISQNYIGRNGDTYNFLTDEEQDIAKEIKNTNVDIASITEKIGQIIFADIFQSKKYNYGKYDFAFDQMVDDTMFGTATGGMKLRFLTVAYDEVRKNELSLMTESDGQAIIVLEDSNYFEMLENVLKVRKYTKQRNVAQLPKSRQDIIRNHVDRANADEIAATAVIRKAIENGRFYVDKEHLTIKAGDAKSKINQCLEYLVAHVYSGLDLIRKNADSEADIISVLSGNEVSLTGFSANSDAGAKILEYLEINKMLPISMADVQSRYQAIPYGWREIDIAYVVAELIYDQKVTIKYAGSTIQPGNPKLVDMLRRRSETGKTMISVRISIGAAQLKDARELLRDYFDVMDVPGDEDGLVAFVVNEFTKQKIHYESIIAKYEDHKYPDKDAIVKSIDIINDILSQQKDNIALITRLLKREDNLYDNKDAMQNVESFFRSQVATYDAAVRFENDLRTDLDYLSKEPEANEALNQIRLIVCTDHGSDYLYRRIPELNSLMDKVKEGHNRLLAAKRAEINEIVVSCLAAIRTAAADDVRVKDAVERADKYFAQVNEKIQNTGTLALLDGLVPPLWQYKDHAVETIENLRKPPVADQSKPVSTPPVKKIYKTVFRQNVCPVKKLESEADIDDYCAKLNAQLKALLNNVDGIEMK